MSYYNAGLRAPQKTVSLYSRGSARVQVGLLPGFVGTDEALRELKLLFGEVDASAAELRDYIAKHPSETDLLAWYQGPWRTFQKRWEAFYNGNKGWWDRFVNPKDIFVKTQDFRREYINLRNLAEKEGMTWGSAPPKDPMAAPSVADDIAKALGLGQLFKWAAIGLLLLGGFFLILTFARG